jgi:hypothetical protein
MFFVQKEKGSKLVKECKRLCGTATKTNTTGFYNAPVTFFTTKVIPVRF